MYVDETQLENFLLDSSLVSKKDLEEVKSTLGEEGSGLGQGLVSRGTLTKDDLRRAEAYVLGIPFVDLKREKLDFATLSLIPEPLSRAYNIVAYKKGPETLEVAMLNIETLEKVEFLKAKLGVKLLPRLSDEESLKAALISYQKLMKTEFGDLIQKENDAMRVVDLLLKHAMLQNAFEIHLEPQERELLIRYRINGVLYEAMVLPQKLISVVTNCVKALANLKTEENRLPQEGRFRIVGEGVSTAFRVSTIPVSYGEKILIRILNGRDSGFTLESLGFNEEQIEQVYKVLRSGRGLVVVSGKAQSGKTTLLYTLLDILNTPTVNLATVEDPIEHPMPRVNHVQVRKEIGLSFPHALRAVMKQSPDVLMVGEVPEAETLSLMLNAAQTGALVLTAVEAKSVSEALSKLKKLKVAEVLVDSELKVVIQLKDKDKRGVAEVALL
jgi:type IV pilus assembly protein PilB